jgi:hypothetical protein
LSDADLKEILMQLNTKREFNIVRKWILWVQINQKNWKHI